MLSARFTFILTTAWMTLTAVAETASTVPFTDEYVVRAWEMDDGLPSNTVSGVTQTPDGYLWVATPEGLTRFDGVRFTSFLKEAAAGPDALLTAVRNDDLWLGFEGGGKARRSGDSDEESVPVLPRTRPPAWIGSLAEDGGELVWYDWGNGRTVTRWKDGEVSEFKGGVVAGPDERPEVRADSSGQIWFATGEKAGGSDRMRFQSIDPGGGSRASLTIARDGGMWAANGNSLRHFKPDGKWETVADLSTIGGGKAVNMLLEDRAGSIWIATRGAGLVRYRDGSFVRVATSHNDVLSLAEDREGNLWAGTHGGGLDQVRRRGFHLHKAEQGLLNDNVVSIAGDAEGRLWMAPSYSPPVRSETAENRSFVAQPGWPDVPSARFVTALCPDPAGGMWFACSNGGLQRWQDGKFIAESLWVPANSLLMDRRRNLWVATAGGGLVRHFEGKDTYISQEDGLVKALALAEDAQGRVWVGTEDGLVFQRRDERFVPVPLPGAKAGQSIRFIVADGSDALWIGASEGGLYRWRAGGIERLPHDAGLPAADLRSLLIEPQGDFWFGTGKGLFRIPRKDIEGAIEGRREPMRVTAYGRQDGLPSTEFNLGFRNAATRTRDGRLWFAVFRGALEIIPENLREPVSPLPVLIDEIRLGETMFPPGNRENFALPPNPGPLQIHYTLPNLNLPERLRFRYRLLGMDRDEWVPATTDRTATFPHLSPGSYRFEVAAAEVNGPWMPATASVRFSVKAAWWETGWFRASLMLLIVAVLAASVRFLVRRRMKTRMEKLMRENALERERTRIARDIHDELGASLTQIAMAGKLAQLELSGIASDHLDEISLAARNTAEALDEIVWAVNPRHDTVASLAEYISKFASGFVGSAGIVCKLEVPGDLPHIPLDSKRRHHLFLVVKEALNNAVKYSGASVLKLKIERETNHFRVIVEDNGCGFDPNANPADGNGLRNMRERMADAGGTCLITSGPGQGTAITFVLPIRQ